MTGAAVKSNSWALLVPTSSVKTLVGGLDVPVAVYDSVVPGIAVTVFYARERPSIKAGRRNNVSFPTEKSGVPQQASSLASTDRIGELASAFS
jgi:hypothetical protein